MNGNIVIICVTVVIVALIFASLVYGVLKDLD